MKYLIGKSKFSGNISAAAFPFENPHLEPEGNRVWEKEITKNEFDNLNKSGGTFCIVSGHKIELFKVKD